MVAADTHRRLPANFAFGGAWPAVLGYGILLVPTLVTLGQQAWRREIGAHGPIVLATGTWLLWRQTSELRQVAAPGGRWGTGVLLVFSLGLYIFGRTYGFLMMEAMGAYGAGLALFYAKLGLRAMHRSWFPLLYLAFSIPPPGWVVDRLTAPLKHLVTYVSTEILHDVGLPVARAGVTITVAQYQLLVEDACSGMHSIIGLIAVSLLYVYLMHGPSIGRLVFLVAMSIPTAIVINTIRIMALVLLTYFFGDRVAEGFLHMTTGVLLFGVAVLFLFAIDKCLDWGVGRVVKARSMAA